MFICIQPFKINFSLKCQHKSPHSINPPVDKPPAIAYLKMVLPFMALNCNILDVVGKRGRQRAWGGWVGSPNESTLTLQPILQQCCLAKFSPGSAELSRSKLTERTPQPSSSALAVATRFAQHLIYSEPEKANRGFSRKMLLPSRDSWFSFRRIPLSVIFSTSGKWDHKEKWILLETMLLVCNMRAGYFVGIFQTYQTLR